MNLNELIIKYTDDLDNINHDYIIGDNVFIVTYEDEVIESVVNQIGVSNRPYVENGDRYRFISKNEKDCFKYLITFEYKETIKHMEKCKKYIQKTK